MLQRDILIISNALAQKLYIIGLSTDPNLLVAIASKLQQIGVHSLQDLQGLSKKEMMNAVKSLSLTPVQINKLFKAVSAL